LAVVGWDTVTWLLELPGLEANLYRGLAAIL
jgi:hypothetical protein